MSISDDLRNKRARENILELQNKAEGIDRILRDMKRRIEKVEEDISSISQQLNRINGLLNERPDR